MASSSLRDKLFTDVEKLPENASVKVTVVGVGQVGMAIAFSILTKKLCGELALVDVDEKKLKGELMDLQHGLQFVPHMKLQASTNYEITAGSKLCIISAGARQREGEDRRALLDRNVQVFKGLSVRMGGPFPIPSDSSNPLSDPMRKLGKAIVPQLVKYSPDTIILVVSNPVDVMAYVAWKLSGLPHHRVIGSGTSLDSSRLRYFMSERLGINVSSCHGFVIGEHGESSVVVWSGVNVAGVRLVDLNKDIGLDTDPEKWIDLHHQVINSATEIIKLKGYTSWAIGLCVSELSDAILKNRCTIYSLSTMAKGHQGIAHEIYVSLPCVLAENGITAVVSLTLTDQEREKLNKSSKELHDLFQSAKL